MTPEVDEYGIPVRQARKNDIDDYGIPIKKKEQSALSSIGGGVVGESTGKDGLFTNILREAKKANKPLTPEENAAGIREAIANTPKYLNQPLSTEQAQEIAVKEIQDEMVKSGDQSDPLKSIYEADHTTKILGNKGSDDDIKIFTEKLKLAKTAFPTAKQAEQYLGGVQGKTTEQLKAEAGSNYTKQAAVKKIEDIRKVENAFQGGRKTLEDAALIYAAENGDETVKYLLDKNEKIGENVIGDKILEFVSRPELHELAEQYPALKQEIKQTIANFPNHYPDAAAKIMSELIAVKRDEKGLNSVGLNLPQKDDTDKIVDELIKEGTLPPNYKFVYEKEIRPKLGTWRGVGRLIGNAIPVLNKAVNDNPIPTPGLVENVVKGAEDVETSIAKSIFGSGGVGLASSFENEPRSVAIAQAKQYAQPQYEPKSIIHQATMHGGQMIPFVASLAGGTGALKAMNLIKNPALASGTMMVLATHGDVVEKAKTLFPGKVGEQLAYIGVSDGLNALMSKFLPGQKLFSKSEPVIKEVIQDLSKGVLSREAAKDKLVSWFANTAKGTIGGAEFMGAIAGADDLLTQTLSGKGVDFSQTLNKAWEGAKTGLIATPFVAGTEAALRNNKGYRNELVNFAENPDYYKDLVKEQAAQDPEFNKTANDILDNIDHLSGVWNEIKDNPAVKNKEGHLINSFNEKIKLSQAENAVNPALKAKYTKEAKNLNEIQQAALNGIPEEKVRINQAIKEVKQMYNDGYLTGVADKMLESVKGENGEPKFDESKVESFLKEVASNPKKQVPARIRELAEELFPPEEKVETESNIKAPEQQVSATQPEVEGTVIYRTSSPISTQSHNDVKYFSPTEERSKGYSGLHGEGAVTESFTINKDAKTFNVSEHLDREGIQQQKGETYRELMFTDNKENIKRLKDEGYDIIDATFTDMDGNKSGEYIVLNDKAVTKKPVEQTPNIKQEGEATIKENIEPVKSVTPETKEPPTAEVSEVIPEATGGEGENIRLTHADTEKIYQEAGLPERLETPTKHFAELEKEAQAKLDKGYNFNRVAEDVMNGKGKFEDSDQLLFARRVADLQAKQKGLDIKSPEFDALQTEIEKLSRASDVAGTIGGRFLQSRKNFVPVEETISDYVQREKELNKVDELTDKQKETIRKEYEDIEKYKADFDAHVAKKEAELSQREAESTVKSYRAKKGEKKDFKAERATLKEQLKAAREEHKEYLKSQGIQTMGIGSFTTKEAKIIGRMIKSYAEETALTLKEIGEKILEEVKDIFPGIDQKDIIDIAAGKYNEKKKTRNELAERMVNIGIEAKLIEKLESLEKGEVPKSEKKKIQRNQQIKDLREKIKPHTDLAAQKKKMQKELSDIQEQIRTGNFEKEKTQPKKIELDKEGLEIRDKLIKAQQNRQVRMALQQRKNETSKERAMRITAEIFNIPRTLMTIGDFSGLLRQNIFFSAGHPLMTKEALPGMFKSFTSQKIYDRWFADLKETPRYDIIEKSKLAIADTLNHDLSKREETFMSSVAEKIPLGIGKIVKGSERSYTMLLNKMRVDMFNYFADSMESRGITYDNSPKAYKAMAEYINNATGRSDFGETLNRVAPILNSIFFSPRLIASRINMLTYFAQPRFWKSLPKEARIDYFRNWASLLAVGGSILALAQLGGADVEDDPRSADFGKIQSGNTRWDIWGGAQPYIRVLAQLVSGQRKSTNTDKLYDLGGKDIFGETRAGVVSDFFRNKLAPVPGAAVDILSGRTSIGDKIVYDWSTDEPKEISIKRYILERILPMTITGTNEAIKDQGLKSLLTVGVPSTFGVGTSTYDTKNITKPKPSSRNQTRETKRKVTKVYSRD